jgi:hypothetical protein
MPLSGAVIHENAMSFHEDLMKDAKEQMLFAASCGLFIHFKHFHVFHNLKVTGEAAAEDHIAAKEFPTLFKALIVEGGYTL